MNQGKLVFAQLLPQSWPQGTSGIVQSQSECGTGGRHLGPEPNVLTLV